MIRIEPSTRLRTNYPHIIKEAKKTGDVVYITRKGEVEAVLMGFDAFNMREESIRLEQIIVDAEHMRIYGEEAYNLDKFGEWLKDALHRED